MVVGSRQPYSASPDSARLSARPAQPQPQPHSPLAAAPRAPADRWRARPRWLAGRRRTSCASPSILVDAMTGRSRCATSPSVSNAVAMPEPMKKAVFCRGPAVASVRAMSATASTEQRPHGQSPMALPAPKANDMPTPGCEWRRAGHRGRHQRSNHHTVTDRCKTGAWCLSAFACGD